MNTVFLLNKVIKSTLTKMLLIRTCCAIFMVYVIIEKTRSELLRTCRQFI